MSERGRRPVDHLVLAANDLGALAATYRRLGFLVGGRNRHPWGTENHIVQLDGSFLELIGLGPEFLRLGSDDPAAPFANTLARSLERGDGLPLVALRSGDAVADAERFAADGIGLARPMRFSRTAEAPDGIRREVAFTTAFAVDPERPSVRFFVCQHHRPENFWNPAMGRHPNGARRLTGLTLLARRPADQQAFLRRLVGHSGAVGPDGSLRFETGRESIEVVTRDRLLGDYGEAAVANGDLTEGVAAFRIGVDAVETVARFLNVMGSPYEARGRRVIVPARTAGGVALCFEPLPDTQAEGEDAGADA